MTAPLPSPERHPMTEAVPVPRSDSDASAVSLAKDEGGTHVPATVVGDAPARARRSPLSFVTGLLQRYSLLALLLASLVAYATWSKTGDVFTQAANFQNIAGSQSVLGVLTLGLLIPMISGNLDLSIGSTAGLASIAAAGAYADAGVPLIVGVLFGIGVGALVGLLNGIVVTKFGIDSFIVTLGTASLILGLVNWYSEGSSIIEGIPQSVITFGGGLTLGIPNLFYVMVVVAIGVYYLLEQTPYGRNLHAIGSNKAASRLVGIRVERDTCLAFVLSGTFAGVAGVMVLAQQGAGNPQVGQSFTLTAIAAAFLGAASFKLGKLNVPGSLVAIFFLAVNITGLTFAGVATWISDVFTGLSLVLAVAFAGLLSRPRKHKATTAS
ncbi:MAG: putative ribose transport system permease protein [Frankiales bacterium]|nr:putative ribose transport system permease protein [Frankiales bacterium]